MTICHGCSRPIEPLAQTRTYHTSCDPMGRVEMLEKGMQTIIKAYDANQDAATDEFVTHGLLKEAIEIARAALAHRPAQMKGER